MDHISALSFLNFSSLVFYFQFNFIWDYFFITSNTDFLLLLLCFHPVFFIFVFSQSFSFLPLSLPHASFLSDSLFFLLSSLPSLVTDGWVNQISQLFYLSLHCSMKIFYIYFPFSFVTSTPWEMPFSVLCISFICTNYCKIYTIFCVYVGEMVALILLYFFSYSFEYVWCILHFYLNYKLLKTYLDSMNPFLIYQGIWIHISTGTRFVMNEIKSCDKVL